MIRNVPCRVGKVDSENRATPCGVGNAGRGCARRYRTISFIATIFIFSSRENRAISAPLAIRPLSPTISHKTPAGVLPARRARATAASVCPSPFTNSPVRATRPNTWPGFTMSSARDFGFARMRIVFALSYAETPVVMPFFAFIETVKFTPVFSVFWLKGTIAESRRLCACEGVIAAQTIPPPYFSIVLMFSPVAASAGIYKSASFSRLGLSTTMSIRPFFTSSIASGTVQESLTQLEAGRVRVLCGNDLVIVVHFLDGEDFDYILCDRGL